MTSKIDIKNLVMTGRAAIEARHEWPHDRSKYMNASEAEQCIRRQWYAKSGYEGEPQSWGYARRGSHGEKYVVESLRAANVPLSYAGDDQHSITDDDLMMAATPDGVLILDNCEGLEIKTIDPRTNRANLPRPAHVTQLQIAMYLLNKHTLPEAERVRGGWLVYMDASNYDDIVSHWVPFDPAVTEKLAPRAKKLLRARKADSLDREGKRTGECDKCPFKAPCGVTTTSPTPGQKRSNRGSNLDKMAQRFMELRGEEDALKQEKDDLKEDIKSELHKRNVTQTVVGSVEIKLTPVKGRTTLDRKAVKAAGIDLSPFEKEGSPSERLDVKAVDAA